MDDDVERDELVCASSLGKVDIGERGLVDMNGINSKPFVRMW